MNTYRKASASSAALLALLLAGTVAPVVLQAQEPVKKEISDEVSTGLTELKGFVDSKDYAGALKLLNGLLAKADPISYDTAMVSQLKAQVLMTMGQYAEAIEPLDRAQKLGEAHAFFDKKAQLDQLYLLCQLNYQLAGEAKLIADQKKFYSIAYAYIDRWLQANPNPTADGHVFAASILYGNATLEPGKTDTEMVKLAREQAEKALYAALNPPEQAYVLLLASLQQLQDHKAAAACLEVLVSKKPSNALYWQQLVGSYLAQAGSATEDRVIQSFYMRTLLTMERAQAAGFMNTPKDYMNMVGIYFNLEQYGKASDILKEGLKSGKIENVRTNWELLSSAFQQNGLEGDAIRTLEEAAGVFPTEGQLELSLGQMHYGAGRVPLALTHLEKAVTKGNLKKPGAAYLFLGFTAFELQKYEEAARWATMAAEHPDIKADDAKRLAKAATEALRERERVMNSKT